MIPRNVLVVFTGWEADYELNVNDMSLDDEEFSRNIEEVRNL